MFRQRPKPNKTAFPDEPNPAPGAGSSATSTASASTADPRATSEDAGSPFDKTPFVDFDARSEDDVQELTNRHGTLMECMRDEVELQGEERQQAAIDEDFYDHLQWRPEDAQVLMERGQAALVFNEARQTVDFIAGTQKRMRKDYKILPQNEAMQAGADVVEHVVKYTDEANLTPWHQSRAFKQAALSGLGWLEEGVNIEPGQEIIYSGSVDWRDVYRDSRAKDLDLRDGRYQFRRRVTDVDYAQALFPKADKYLRSVSSTQESLDDDERWYLGQRLTGASDLDLGLSIGLGMRNGSRRAYISSSYHDLGRRQCVELLECWYRVPEAVQVFDDGPLDGAIYDAAVAQHVTAKAQGIPMYQAVKMRMRVMVATKERPLWDGPSPFAHDDFILIPVWGFRRYRDGVTYGSMRGMRDLQEDSNKRASKAQWLLANNLMIIDKGAVEDIEQARDEAARSDGVIERVPGKKIEFVKRQAEAQSNLEMMDRNVQFMRDIGGVTNANLGRGAAGQSGISIERQQDQGSLTTMELFDNFNLARKLAGRQRLSNIKRFKTKEQVLRITGGAAPPTWIPVNRRQADGSVMNDLTAIDCDFIVSDQDYRESYVRAATAEMFALLGQIAQFAPQVVLNVLDLAVQGAEIPNKEEWVARIRAMNGQRDATKPLSPAEQQAQAEQQAEQQQAKAINQAMMQAQLKKLQGDIDKLDVDSAMVRVQGLLVALQAAQIVATTPGTTPVADVIAQEAGFTIAPGDDPNIPEAAHQAAAMALAAQPQQAQQPANPAPGAGSGQPNPQQPAPVRPAPQGAPA